MIAVKKRRRDGYLYEIKGFNTIVDKFFDAYDVKNKIAYIEIAHDWGEANFRIVSDSEELKKVFKDEMVDYFKIGDSEIAIEDWDNFCGYERVASDRNIDHVFKQIGVDVVGK